jgi:ribosomal protein S18 acetylase RimI-like enzyme
MSARIRRAGPGDEALFARIAPGVFDEPVRPDRLAAYLADPGNLMLLAIDDERVVGQCAAVIHRHPDKPTEIYIDEVGVAPGFRRRGIAGRMMEAMLALARELGCEEAWVGTEAGNLPARQLYARFADAEPIALFQWEL